MWRQSLHRLGIEHAADLVGRARGGDRSAWDELVNRYLGLVWAIARDHGLADADAASAVQVTFLRLLEHLETIREPALVGQWLASTAEQECGRVAAMVAWSSGPPPEVFVPEPRRPPQPMHPLPISPAD